MWNKWKCFPLPRIMLLSSLGSAPLISEAQIWVAWNRHNECILDLVRARSQPYLSLPAHSSICRPPSPSPKCLLSVSFLSSPYTRSPAQPLSWLLASACYPFSSSCTGSGRPHQPISLKVVQKWFIALLWHSQFRVRTLQWTGRGDCTVSCLLWSECKYG